MAIFKQLNKAESTIRCVSHEGIHDKTVHTQQGDNEPCAPIEVLTEHALALGGAWHALGFFQKVNWGNDRWLC